MPLTGATMERLEGCSIEDIIDEMNECQRISLAEQVTHLLSTIYVAPVPPGIGPLCFRLNGAAYVGAHCVFPGVPASLNSLPAPELF